MPKNYPNNQQIAELMRSVAAAYQLEDANKNKFRIIAYDRAADAIEHATSELKDLWDEGKLDEVPGIGPNIAGHLDELFKTGKVTHFNEIMKDLPKGMFEIMQVPGVGAKTAYKLTKELNIKNISDLEKAAKEGKIKNIEGFGVESQTNILRSVKEITNREVRHLLPYAAEVAGQVIAWMQELKSIEKIDPLGSLRRKSATVGDIDISVATNNPKEALEHFTKYPKLTRIIEKGDKTSSIVLPGNLQVDLMTTPPESYGSLLQHFTGSKHHNIALREYALKRGLSLSEYGIKNVKSKELFKFKTEKEFYNYLGLDYIEPELREDTGEIEAAQTNKLPKLVKFGEIKGDLHMHSSFDIETSHDTGESTFTEMIQKGNELGYEYLVFTEHNPSNSKHNQNEVLEILEAKRKAIDELNYSLVKGVKGSIKKVFNSLEIDILPDGSLPISDEGLAQLDFALVSVHSSFRLSRSEMTKRVLNALNHPKVKIFAHPTARKINEREGIELNWPEIFEFCAKNNKWIEINADPMRLDLPDNLVKEAIKAGVKLTIGTDAHHKDGLNNMDFGVAVARRGWAKSSDIINTLSLSEFEKLLKEGD